MEEKTETLDTTLDSDSDYIKVESGNSGTLPESNQGSTSNYRSSLSSVPRDVLNFVTALSTKVGFSALTISLVGYIVISSFGYMQTSNEFWRYIIFLSFSLLLYKLFILKKISFDVSKRSWLWLSIVTILSTILLLTNWDYVARGFNFVSLSIQTNTPDSQ